MAAVSSSVQHAPLLYWRIKNNLKSESNFKSAGHLLTSRQNLLGFIYMHLKIGKTSNFWNINFSPGISFQQNFVFYSFDKLVTSHWFSHSVFSRTPKDSAVTLLEDQKNNNDNKRKLVWPLWNQIMQMKITNQSSLQ